MPRISVFGKALRDLRWQVFWYGLGFALLAALVAYIYPSYRDQLGRAADLERAVARLRSGRRFRVVFDEDGILVLHR